MPGPLRTVSIPRFAPLGDMALSFDGAATAAQTTLPTNLLATPENNGLKPFTVTFWMNAAPPPETPTSEAAATGPDTETGAAAGPSTPPPSTPPPSTPQTVVEILGTSSGPLAAITLDTDYVLTLQMHALVDPVRIPLGPGVGSWVFVAASYSNTPGFGTATLLVTDGRPQPFTAQNALAAAVTLSSQDTALTLTLGRATASDVTPTTAYAGMLTRLRLWNTALTAEQAVAEMYVYPIGPQAYAAGPLIGDWRLSEGYGNVAFDYASAGDDRVPKQYAPPPGNHLTLGTARPDGIVADAPGWVIVDLSTLVVKATNAALPLA